MPIESHLAEKPERWTFDHEVADAFDDMLTRSIPQYDVMRRTVFEISKPFVRSGYDIVDLGASRGEAIAPFVESVANEIGGGHFICVETSAPMVAALNERFEGNPRVQILPFDLRKGYIYGTACVTLSVLTLQFTPIEHRQRILRDVFKRTTYGGCFVLVEKVLGKTAQLDQIFVDRYYDLKRANGYSDQEIDRKRLALEGVLVPVTAEWNEQLLHAAGFAHVDCFWRWCNFAGWIAIKS